MLAAQIAKTEKHLNSPIRFEGVVFPTRKDFIAHLKALQVVPEITQVPELIYSRSKYNNMDAHLQDEYLRRCTEKTKIAYRARFPDGILLELSKSEYDYFISQ